MEKRDFFVKIAHMYYVLKMTQNEIADRFSISRQKVNQIIGSLEEMGIVSIYINGYENRNIVLENTIEKKFNLKQVLVAPVQDNFTIDNIINEVSSLAASYLDMLLPQKKRIGVSLGRLLEKTVQRMKYHNNISSRVIQLFGVQNALGDHTKATEIARLLGERLNCTCYTMYSPGIVSSPELRNMLLKEKSICKYMDYISTCDAAVIGIGAIKADAFKQLNFFSEDDINLLHSAGFNSVVCLNPVRSDGTWHNCPMADRIIGIDIPSLVKIPDVIAISAGKEKAASVLSVLKTSCIDTLIIDSQTAEFLSSSFSC